MIALAWFVVLVVGCAPFAWCVLPCSLRCGYRYALRVVRLARESRP